MELNQPKMKKTYGSQLGLHVYPPDKKSVLTDTEKRWKAPVRIPRHHLVRPDDRRAFRRLYEGSGKLLACEWCAERRAIRHASDQTSGNSAPALTAPPPTPMFPCCRTSCRAYKAHPTRPPPPPPPQPPPQSPPHPPPQLPPQPWPEIQYCVHVHRPDVAYPPSKAARMAYQPDALMHAIRKDLVKNCRTQAPPSTVMVRWHNVKRDPGYTLDTIHSELIKLGDVTNIVRTSELSARATFRDLSDACQAVNRRYLGRASNPMLVLWYHRTMKNKTFHLSKSHIHVHVNPVT